MFDEWPKGNNYSKIEWLYFGTYVMDICQAFVLTIDSLASELQVSDKCKMSLDSVSAKSSSCVSSAPLIVSWLPVHLSIISIKMLIKTF